MIPSLIGTSAKCISKFKGFEEVTPTSNIAPTSTNRSPSRAIRDLVDLAVELVDAPLAVLTLGDGETDRVFYAAGRLGESMPIQSALCTADGLAAFTEVEDMRSDANFAAHPFVAGEPRLVYQAIATLPSRPGQPVYKLCAFDEQPRRFDWNMTRRFLKLAEIARGLLARERAAVLLKEARVAHKRQRLQIQSQLDTMSRQNRTFDQASQLAKIGTWEIDDRTGKVEWSDNLFRLLDLPHDVAITRDTITSHYTPSSLRRLKRVADEASRNKTGYVFEGAANDQGGGKRWFRQIADVDVEDGVIVRRYGSKQDITEQKALIDQLSFMATRDSLTRLSNREALHRALSETLGASKPNELNALFILDLDGFKNVNDSYGHPAGDFCLRQLGRRLRRICPAPATVARLGGDEFAVLIRNVGGEDNIEKLANRIIADFRAPVKHKSVSYDLSTSVGYTSWRGAERLVAEDLLTEADLALNVAKVAGKNTCRAFLADMKKTAQRRSDTLAAISRALTDGHLEVFYQPKFKLQDRSPAGYEALLRWRRGENLISPTLFKVALEDPEMARRIGNFVMAESLTQASQWKRDGLRFGRVAINVSRSQFQSEYFVLDLIADVRARPWARRSRSRDYRRRAAEHSRPSRAEAPERSEERRHMRNARRFRDGLRLAHAFAQPRRELPENRPQLCLRNGQQQRRSLDRQCGDQTGGGDGNAARRRRNRDGRTAFHPDRHGLPIRTGLSLRQSATREHHHALDAHDRHKRPRRGPLFRMTNASADAAANLVE